jgi:hypothetical protein
MKRGDIVSLLWVSRVGNTQREEIVVTDPEHPVLLDPPPGMVTCVGMYIIGNIAKVYASRFAPTKIKRPWNWKDEQRNKHSPRHSRRNHANHHRS